MMTRSSSIGTPETEQLAHLKAMSDAAQAHKYFQDNPKVIDQLAAKISGAYALTEAERKERDEAVASVREAEAAAGTAKKDLEDAKLEAWQTRKEAEEYLAKAKREADKYKKEAMAAISAAQQKVIDDNAALAEREGSLEKAQTALSEEQKGVEEGLQKITEWETAKEEWEKDYTERSAKLDAKMRAAVKR